MIGKPRIPCDAQSRKQLVESIENGKPKRALVIAFYLLNRGYGRAIPCPGTVKIDLPISEIPLQAPSCRLMIRVGKTVRIEDNAQGRAESNQILSEAGVDGRKEKSHGFSSCPAQPVQQRGFQRRIHLP